MEMMKAKDVLVNDFLFYQDCFRHVVDTRKSWGDMIDVEFEKGAGRIALFAPDDYVLIERY